MIIAGIDIGLTGWVAFLEKGKPMHEMAYPLKQGWKDRLMICQHVYIEEPQARPAQNVKATATSWKNYGRIIGWLESHGVEYTTVHAVTWKAKLGLSRTKVVKNWTKKQIKEHAVKAAEILFPNAGFYGSKGGMLDGKAEAYLIAYYGDAIERKKLTDKRYCD